MKKYMIFLLQKIYDIFTTKNIIYFLEITPPTKKNKKEKKTKNNKHSEQNIKVEIAKNNAKFGS